MGNRRHNHGSRRGGEPVVRQPPRRHRHVNRSATIGDPPMSRDQLHGFVTAIFDADMIGPEPASLRGRRLIHQKIWRDAHSDTLGRGAGREEGIQYAGHKPAPFSA